MNNDKLSIHKWEWYDTQDNKKWAYILARDEHDAHRTLMEYLPEKDKTKVIGMNRQPYFCQIDLISESERQRLYNWLKKKYKGK